MKRNDDYGLNTNERYIYRMSKEILIYKKDVSLKDIIGAMNDSIELGIGRRIDNDYNYNLVKSRLCNWFDVDKEKHKITITKNKNQESWYYEYFINLNGEYVGFIGKIHKKNKWLNVCSSTFGINSVDGDFKTIKDVRKLIESKI